MFAPSPTPATSAAPPSCCQITQPSLSQQILKLEEDLGVKLFDRLGRSVRLTEAGRVFVPQARAILEQMDVARSSVAEKNADLRGSVAVGVIPTVAPYLMPAYTAAFAKKYPDAKLRIIEETTSVLIEGLRDLSIDVANPGSPTTPQRSRAIPDPHRAAIRRPKKKRPARPGHVARPQRSPRRILRHAPRRPLLPRSQHQHLHPRPRHSQHCFRKRPVQQPPRNGRSRRRRLPNSRNGHRPQRRLPLRPPQRPQSHPHYRSRHPPLSQPKPNPTRLPLRTKTRICGKKPLGRAIEPIRSQAVFNA